MIPSFQKPAGEKGVEKKLPSMVLFLQVTSLDTSRAWVLFWQPVILDSSGEMKFKLH